jgi:hypothetical protein
MKNRKSNITTIAASLFAITSLALPMAAHAQSAATANNTAGAAAQAAVNVNSPLTAPITASGGSAGASITGVDLKTGDASAGATVDFKPTSTTAMTFEASKIPLQSAGIPIVTPGQAQLFISNGATSPPQITGALVGRTALSLCAPKYTRTNAGRTEGLRSATGDVKIRFSAFPDYDNKRSATSEVSPVVSFDLPAPKTQVVCIGVMTIQAEKSDVDIGALDNEAAQAAVKLSGYKAVYLVSPQHSIGGALGVTSSGRGFGIGGSGAGIAGAVTAALGLSGGTNSGETIPVARLGATYVVLAEPGSYGPSATMSPSDFAVTQSMSAVPTAPAGVTVKEAAGAKK